MALGTSIPTLLLMSSFTLGFSHAFEVDHLSAVSTFIARRPGWREALGYGTKWAVGHGLSLLVFGSGLFLLKTVLAESVAVTLERLVGIVLLSIGLLSLKRSFSMQTGQAHTHRHGTLWMGVLHGLAGTAAFIGQSVVVAAHSWIFVALYTLAFSLGVLFAMALYGAIMGGLFSITAARSASVFKKLQLGTALWAVGVGVFWVLR